jgi:acetyl esterase/lipase
MYLLIFCLSLVLGIWAFERFYLRGPRPAEYPKPETRGTLSTFSNPEGPGAQHQAVVDAVRGLTKQISLAVGKNRMQAARAVIDSMSDGRDYVSAFLPVDAGGVPAEWVLAPGADKTRRVLYIHGGGFIMGSPKSHRTITSKFSEITGCAVLAIDYRLLPEYKHMDCVEDCRTAYQWILENGPDGPGKVQQLFIGGDSAGGNLALSLIAWIRDNGLRTPEAVVALSPLTDTTFSGASIRDNEATGYRNS